RAVSQQRYELSERVRANQIYGFLEIAPDVLESARPGAESSDRSGSPESSMVAAPARMIRFQSDHATADAVPNWAEEVLTAAIEKTRASQAGVSESELQRILKKVPLVSKGLSNRNAQTGEIEEAADQNQLASLLVPGGLMFLMFML